MNSYRQLDAWQRSHELALFVYRLTRGFPAEERYGLISQARRAAFSAAANIAEGSSRRTPGQFAHFLDIALGSVGELSYVFDLAADLDYVRPDDLVRVRSIHTSASQLTWRLYEFHRRKAGR